MRIAFHAAFHMLFYGVLFIQWHNYVCCCWSVYQTNATKQIQLGIVSLQDEHFFLIIRLNEWRYCFWPWSLKKRHFCAKYVFKTCQHCQQTVKWKKNFYTFYTLLYKIIIRWSFFASASKYQKNIPYSNWTKLCSPPVCTTSALGFPYFPRP